jgi:hypothetical protein
MKALLLVTLSIALLSIPGSAAPCMTTTLANYIALGSTGCTLGNLQVGGFAYKANADGGAAEITADQITVTPLLAPTGTFGLEFTAPWGVQAGQGQLSAITYRALSSAASVQIQEIRLDGSGFQAGMFGNVIVNETVATPAAALDLQVYLKCTEVCRSDMSDLVSLTPPASELIVTDRVTLQSKLGAAALTGFADWFVVCLACV